MFIYNATKSEYKARQQHFKTAQFLETNTFEDIVFLETMGKSMTPAKALEISLAKKARKIYKL
jgi:hypothetical protein